MKKPNPQDSTLRNVRAAAKRIGNLQAQIDALFTLTSAQDDRIRLLERLAQKAPSEPTGPRRRR